MFKTLFTSGFSNPLSINSIAGIALAFASVQAKAADQLKALLWRPSRIRKPLELSLTDAGRIRIL
jgi:hypothetical protein